MGPRGLLGFRAEYAKSNHSTCKGCSQKIDKETLRLAKVFQSRSFGGQLPVWYHYDCFWDHAWTRRLGAFKGLDMLRWEDQQKIKEKIAGQPGDRHVSSLSYDDFVADFASSSASKCKECTGRIFKHTVRLCRKSRRGQSSWWYHVECFIERRLDLGFGNDREPQKMVGFDKLKAEDQKMLEEKFQQIKPAFTQNNVVSDSDNDSDDDSPPVKKRKKEESTEEKLMKEQTQLIWHNRDNLRKCTIKAQHRELLEYNAQAVPFADSQLLEQLSDVMTFGALMPCEQCGGQLVFSGNYIGYKCRGHVSGWTKCDISTKTPKRIPFIVPKSLQDIKFLAEYQYSPRDRYFPVIKKSKLKKADSDASSVSSNDSSSSAKPKLNPNRLQPLKGMRFVIVGKTSKSKHDMKRTILELGGKVAHRIDKTIAACISNKDVVKKHPPKIQEAEAADVHVVNEEFLDAVKKGGAVLLIQAHSIASWGSDPLDRIDDGAFSKPKHAKQRVSACGSVGASAGDKKTLIWKDGQAVDLQSGLQSEAHVFQEDSVAYNAVLGLVDISLGLNAFYKIQLLQADNKKKFWLFRLWGQLGRPDVGGMRLKEYETKYDVVKKFKGLYREKTGNPWGKSEYFVKKPNKFYPVDIDYGSDVDTKLGDSKTCTLEQPIQDLVKMLFDVESMKKTMLEFEIDLSKMPLGKLSHKQLEEGYSVLGKLQKLMDKGDSKQIEILDASNQFYTLIPHTFRDNKPTLLDSEDIIKAKREMLDNLMEIEIAYSLMKGDSGAGKDPIQEHYEKLQTDIKVLDKSSEEFLLIGKYVENTQQKGKWSGYNANIIDVFKIERHGEANRYQPFVNLHNRKLLWHGSRVTNFAGILSQGLRIAPPEAPMSGYMFGKGLYFADMLAKSANYCRASSSSPNGLLLLCEVALGDMYENTTFNQVDKLPDGNHSLKGIGRHCPDPSESHLTAGCVEIPLGKCTGGPGKNLEYNEYVVYDPAQVHMKYLVKLKLH